MFSVIIPLYNKAQTITYTLQSVFNQTYRDFEVIIVDDGSKDDGLEVVKKNFDDPRIRIIQQKNSGVSAARNRGVREARYEYISFIDADDEWMPAYLENMCEILKKFPEANMMCAGSFTKDFQTGIIAAPGIIEKYTGRTLPLNYFINPGKMGHIGATSFRKSVFLKVGGFPEEISSCEDVCLNMRVALEGLFVYCGKLLHVYVHNVPGQTTSNTCEIVAIKNDTFVANDIYERWKKQADKNPLVPVFLKYFIRHFFFVNLKRKQYTAIETLTDRLSFDFKKLLGSFFIKNVNKSRFRQFFILYIGITKVIWRIHRFPRVGKPIKNEKALIEQYNINDTRK